MLGRAGEKTHLVGNGRVASRGRLQKHSRLRSLGEGTRAVTRVGDVGA